MFKKLKQILVESFVAAIALGWLLAQGIMHFANIFTAPVASWVARKEYQGFGTHPYASADFSLRPALPELAKSALLLLFCYILLRWLYFKSPEQTGSASDRGSPA